MEINYYICDGCGRKVPDDLELERCPLCGCSSYKSSLYPDVSYSIEDTSLINSHWDKGAYKTSIDPKMHRPIKPPEESQMDANEYCCRKCFFCLRAEFPPHEPKMIQFICKRNGVSGELINQYPEPLDDRLDEEHNWCGDGLWWYDFGCGNRLSSIEQIANHEKNKEEKTKKS